MFGLPIRIRSRVTRSIARDQALMFYCLLPPVVLVLAGFLISAAGLKWGLLLNGVAVLLMGAGAVLFHRMEQSIRKLYNIPRRQKPVLGFKDMSSEAAFDAWLAAHDRQPLAPMVPG